MAGYNIPNIQPITPKSFADMSSAMMTNAIRGNTALARAMNGGRVGGRRGVATTQQVWTGQFDANGNPVFTTVPKGMTQKERAAFLQAQQANQAQRALQNDTVINEKLSRLNSVPVAEQAQILEDIRRNDIDRLTKTFGVSSGELFRTMLQPFQDEVEKRQTDISNSDGLSALWDGLKIGAHGFVSSLAAAVKGGGAERYKVAAEEHQRYRDKVLEENAFLRDQELRAAQGEGTFERMSGPTGSVLGTIGAAAGEMLPSAGAGIAGSIAGAKIGGVTAGPYGALVGALVGGAVPTASYEPFALAQRVVNDPTLSEEQKLEAIDKGILPAAGIGAATGAIPAGVGAVGGRLLGAVARAGAPGVSRVAEAVSAPSANALARYAQRVGTTGTELGLMNTATIMGQNANFAQATGREVPLTEGVAEGLSQAVLAAPLFGLMPRNQPRPEPMAKPVTEPVVTTEPNAAAGNVTPKADTNIVPPEFMRTFWSGVRNNRDAGVPIDAGAIVKAWNDAGYTTEQLVTRLDGDSKVATQARLGASIIRPIREYLDTQTRTPADVALSDFAKAVKSAKYEDDFTAAYNAVREVEGVTQERIAETFKGIKNLAERKKVWFENITSEAEVAPVAEASTEVISPQPVAEPKINIAHPEPVRTEGTTDAIQDTGSGTAGRATPEVSLVGADDAGAKAAALTANLDANSGVAADTAGAASATPVIRPEELAGSNRTIESGRIGGTEEPGIRQDQAVDGITQVAGDVPSTGETVSRPSDTITPTGRTESDSGTRSAVRQANRSVSDGSDAAPASRVAVTPEQVQIKLGQSDAIVSVPDGESFIVFKNNGKWSVGLSKDSEQLVSGEKTRKAAIERARELAVERANSAPEVIVRRARDESLTAREEVSPVAMDEAGLTPEAVAIQNSFDIVPGETRNAITPADDMQIKILQGLMGYETDRLAPVLGRKVGGKSLSDTDIVEARVRTVDILVKESLGEKLTVKDTKIANYLHDELGLAKVKLPADIRLAYNAAKETGLNVNTRQIAETVMDPDTSVRKIIDRVWCKA